MKDPTVEDFHNDMNEHGDADYKRVSPNYVLELDSTPAGWWLTIWKGVRDADTYVPPEHSKNRYFWDAAGRQEFADYEDGREVYDDLTTRTQVESFCSDHPYTGPRTPYHEQ